jgi:hypothetical protein
MDMFGHVKNVLRELIDISLVLIALAIVLSILVAAQQCRSSDRWLTI